MVQIVGQPLYNPKLANAKRQCEAFFAKLEQLSADNPPPGPNAANGYWVDRTHKATEPQGALWTLMEKGGQDYGAGDGEWLFNLSSVKRQMRY